MPRKADPKKAAEKAAKTEDLVKALKDRATMFRESDETYNRLLRMAARFHKYSIANQFLIFYQAPDAVAVNSFKRWQEIGRQVRKGEKGIYIRAPRPYKEKDLMGVEREHVAFRWVPVFSYESTDPMEDFDGTPWEPYYFPTLTEDVGEDYVIGLLRHLEEEGVETEQFTDNRRYRGRFVVPEDGEKPIIRLNVANPMLQQLSTLVHEIAHYEHWKKDARSLQTFGKSSVEFIAEASAHVVLNELGFDTTDKSVPYIAAQRASGDDPEKEAVLMKFVVDITGSIMERLEDMAGAEFPAVVEEAVA